MPWMPMSCSFFITTSMMLAKWIIRYILHYVGPGLLHLVKGQNRSFHRIVPLTLPSAKHLQKNPNAIMLHEAINPQSQRFRLQIHKLIDIINVPKPRQSSPVQIQLQITKNIITLVYKRNLSVFSGLE
jgi:hypothetical protein